MSNYQNPRSGAVALLSVIVMGGILTVLAVAVVVTTLSARQSVWVLGQSDLVYIPMEGCAEEAMIQARRDELYTGGTLTIDGVDCTMDVSGLTNNTIEVTGAKNNITHDLTIEFRAGMITTGITGWQD